MKWKKLPGKRFLTNFFIRVIYYLSSGNQREIAYFYENILDELEARDKKEYSNQRVLCFEILSLDPELLDTPHNYTINYLSLKIKTCV